MTVGLVPLASGHTSPWTRVAVVDAREMPAEVVDAFVDVVEHLCEPELPEGDPFVAFVDLCQERAGRLEGDARIQFAGLVGALFHELRHVHDLLGTMTGALLAMHWARIVGQAEPIVELLTRWCEEDPQRRVPIPLTPDWLETTLQDPSLADILRSTTEELVGLSDTWTRPSYEDLSIRDLYEANAYFTQWLVTTRIFGEDVARAIDEKTAANEAARRRYYVASAYAVQFAGFELHDTAVPVLLLSALEEAAFEDPYLAFTEEAARGAVIYLDRLPGPVPFYARLVHRLKYVERAALPPEEVALEVVKMVVKESSAPDDETDPERRVLMRGAHLNTLRDQFLRDLVLSPDGTWHASVLAYLIGEIPTTYRELVGSRREPQDHDGRIWAARCIDGVAPAISVRVYLPGGRVWNGRTRSPWNGKEDVADIGGRTARQWQVLTQWPDLTVDPPEVLDLRNALIESADAATGPRVRLRKRTGS